jgi:YfiH family protein
VSEPALTPGLTTARVAAFDALPGLVHGFERRRPGGGPESREETRTRVAKALAEAGRLYLLTQVHGATVVTAPFEGRPAADAQVTAQPGALLGVETADCLPILLVDPERELLAAVHAGWRGTAASVVGAAVLGLMARGARPDRLLAALGPGIGPCCYEVGEEVRAAFGPEGARFFREGPRGRPHLDVRAANVAALERAGLRPERIHHVADCTFCRVGLYHSYRRDGAKAGRMISFIGTLRNRDPRAPRDSEGT